MSFVGDLAVYNVPKCRAEVLTSMSKCRRSVMCLWRISCQISLIQGMSHGAVHSSVFISQQYILHKVSLSRNTNKSWSRIAQLMTIGDLSLAGI